MKTYVQILLFFAAMCAFTACVNPDNMVTVIKSDGSCYKEFSTQAGKDFMLGKNRDDQKYFPIDLDASWKITWKMEDSTQIHTDFPISQATYDAIAASMPSQKDPKTNKIEKKQPVFDLLIRKEFPSVEAMSKEFRLRKSHEWSQMKIKYHLDKQFRWFYTYYTYKETYPKVDTKFSIPIDSFMTKQEASFWFTGEPNLYKGMNGVEIREAIGSLENKYNRWFAKNLWEQQFNLLLQHFDQMSAAPVSKDSLAKANDVIFQAKVKGEWEFNMETILNDYYKTKAFSIYWKTNESILKKFEKDFEKQAFVSFFNKEFTYNLCLPGQITPKDNVVMHGDTLTWKLTAYRMIYSDFVIEAESRKANVWAFIVSGLIVVLAIGSFWFKPKR